MIALFHGGSRIGFRQQVPTEKVIDFLARAASCEPIVHRMPTRPSKRKMPRDVNQMAAAIVRQTTEPESQPEPEQDTRNPAAVALGLLGASKGGKARAKSLSKKKRAEIAKKAAKSRWNERNK